MNQSQTASDQQDASPAHPPAAPQFHTHVPHRERGDRPPAEAHIQTRDFSIFYADFEAVKTVSVDMLKNEVTAIIGPSGCGKSTFLHAINRMNDLIPTCHAKGTMLFDGVDIYDPGVDVVDLRRKIGMVFQKPNPFPKSIYDNITYAPKLHGTRKKSDLDAIVERSLKQAALWDEVKDRLRSNGMSLSGGQQQRLCIARAIAIEPEVLLMDEPTSALDPRSTAGIEDLIAELREIYTIVIVTHNMQQAARVSDKTIFLYEGLLIEVGPTEKIFTNPDEERTEQYVTGRFS